MSCAGWVSGLEDFKFSVLRLGYFARTLEILRFSGHTLSPNTYTFFAFTARLLRPNPSNSSLLRLDCFALTLQISVFTVRLFRSLSLSLSQQRKASSGSSRLSAVLSAGGLFLI